MEVENNFVDDFNKEVFKLIVSLEHLGIDMTNYRTRIYDIFGSDSYTVLLGVKSVYYEIFKKYNNFLNINRFFSSLNIKLNNYDISSDVGVIINVLENLKNDDLFLNDSMIFLIEDIYKICYLYMKLDFLYNHSSMLFDYFKSNYHDFWYINEFIKLDIEELNSSINFLNGLDELNVLIDSRDDKSHFMFGSILDKMSYVMYFKVYKKYVLKKINEFKVNFSRIHQRILDLVNFSTNDIIIKNRVRELKRNYEELLDEYYDFVRNNQLECDGKLSDIEDLSLNLKTFFLC